MQVHEQILERRAGQQLFDAPQNRKQTGLPWQRRLLENAGEPLKADRFI
jgi:hypothetical protein